MYLIPIKYKKLICSLLLVCTIFTGIIIPTPQTPKAEAYFASIANQLADMAANVRQWAVEAARWVTQNGWRITDWAIRVAMARLIREMTKAIVAWIDSGFKGNPAFITDTKGFLQDTMDITIGDMLMGSDLAFLCDPFKLNLKLSLGLQYQPFRENIRCSFTSAKGNINDAYNNFVSGDFINGGGWDSWLQITTVPQNNQVGAMMLARGELDARIEGNKNIQLTEANWGGGFMSWKECTPLPDTVTGDTTGEDSVYDESTSRADYYNGKGDVVGTIQENQKCTIQTPGSTIANKLDWADTSDIRKTELANGVDAIINALLNQLITELSDGLLKRSSGSAKRSTAAADNLTYLNSLQTKIDSINGATTDSGSGSGATINNASGIPTYTAPQAVVNNNQGVVLSDAKSTLQNSIENLMNSETAFYNAHNYIITTGNFVAGLFSNVISCYEAKINSGTLTSNQISTANSRINTASTSINQINTIKASSTLPLSSAQTNLSYLQVISTQLGDSSDINTINEVQSNLDEIIGNFHTAEQVTIAENTASTTNVLYSQYGATADTMNTQCSAFP